MLGLNPCFRAFFKKLLQPLMPEAFNHGGIVSCNVTSYEPWSIQWQQCHGFKVALLALERGTLFCPLKQISEAIVIEPQLSHVGFQGSHELAFEEHGTELAGGEPLHQVSGAHNTLC